MMPTVSKGEVIGSREAVLAHPWLTAGRLFWVVVTLAALVSYGALASRGSRMLLVESVVSDSYPALAGFVSYTGYARLILVVRYLVVAFFFAVGLFIFWRKSNTVMGLVASLTVIMLPLFAGLGGQAPFYPETLSADFWSLVAVVDSFVYFAGFITTLLFIGLFPSGRFPGRRLTVIGSVVFAFMAIAGMLTTLVADWDYYLIWALFLVTFLAALALTFGGAIYRYFRVSNPMEKQQTRWVMSSAVLIVLWAIFVAGADPFPSYDSRAPWFALFQLFGTVIVASLVPLSIAVAITRYRLWDIDVVVRKTLVYALLTGALLLVYFISIVLLQNIFTRLTGQTSTLATILSTLLIAALFLPMRRRIQIWIDRRFFRRKYDAAKVLEDFAATCRDETDIDRLTAELVRVIQETMQPEHVSVLLFDDGRSIGERE